ncbi:MAG: hypothetical protein KKA42_01930 [candidate division Zixibacteria bacterium]|nr:hypothetical protein [candidate division Zixibacteria bacterium]
MHARIGFLGVLLGVVLLSLFSGGCSDDSVDPRPAPGTIVPLEVGNRWVYRVFTYPAGGDPIESTDSIVIVSKDTTGDETVYRTHVGEVMAERASGLWFARSESDSLTLLFEYPTFIGAGWPFGPAFEWYVTVVGTRTPVQVPTGNYNCYVYVRSEAVAVPREWEKFYVVPDVGIVQYQKLDSTQTEILELRVLSTVQLQ